VLTRRSRFVFFVLATVVLTYPTKKRVVVLIMHASSVARRIGPRSHGALVDPPYSLLANMCRRRHIPDTKESLTPLHTNNLSLVHIWMDMLLMHHEEACMTTHDNFFNTLNKSDFASTLYTGCLGHQTTRGAVLWYS
jgi:hypothetical protein